MSMDPNEQKDDPANSSSSEPDAAKDTEQGLHNPHGAAEQGRSKGEKSAPPQQQTFLPN